MKKMKIEISRLQDENDELLNEQYTREYVSVNYYLRERYVP